MQISKKKELPKRSRYYKGNIDLDLIAKGMKYTELKPSYVIFICTFDPFGGRRSYYTFKEISWRNQIYYWRIVQNGYS